LVDDVVVGRAEQERVAVCGRAHHLAHADLAAAAGAEVDHRGLAEPLLQARLDAAQDDVARPARRIGNDDADRLGRIGLRVRGERKRAGGSKDEVARHSLYPMIEAPVWRSSSRPKRYLSSGPSKGGCSSFCSASENGSTSSTTKVWPAMLPATSVGRSRSSAA